MKFAKRLGMALVCLLAVATTAWGIEPANPNATQDARKVLTYLYELPKRSENRIVSGHLGGGAVGPGAKNDGAYKFTMKEIEYLHNVSGQWVGLVGADYCAGFLKCQNPVEDTMYYKDINRELIDYWNAGGLIAICTHQFDPRKLHKDGGCCFTKDLPKGEAPLDISRLYTPGCEEYDNFRLIMDRWSEGLQELADHGVVVLWRPYNEATNSGKWWCRQPADQFKALYRYTFDYMTRAKGLNNLLWIYDGINEKKELNMSHYPGDNCVDVAGYTMNWDSGPVRQVTHPYPKKVFGCVEFNVPADTNKVSPAALPRNYDYMKKFTWMKENLPYSSFFMSWNRIWGPYGRGTPESVKAMFNDPSVANRGEIDWRNVAAGPKSR